MDITISDDPKVPDEEWLSLVFDDLWDMVKAVRKRSGPRKRSYLLSFYGSQVTVTVQRTYPPPTTKATPHAKKAPKP